MKALKLLVLLGLFFTSCSEGEDFSNHNLTGDYLGSWETNTLIELRMTISANAENDGLVLFISSLANGRDLNIVSETEFQTDRFEENTFSHQLTGTLEGDTLFIENDTYAASDPDQTRKIRKGTFVKQE